MTLPPYQRQGYGRLLIDFSKTFIKADCVCVLNLICHLNEQLDSGMLDLINQKISLTPD